MSCRVVEVMLSVPYRPRTQHCMRLSYLEVELESSGTVIRRRVTASFCRMLDLSGNAVSGSVPAEMSALVSLRFVVCCCGALCQVGVFVLKHNSARAIHLLFCP